MQEPPKVEELQPKAPVTNPPLPVAPSVCAPAPDSAAAAAQNQTQPNISLCTQSSLVIDANAGHRAQTMRHTYTPGPPPSSSAPATATKRKEPNGVAPAPKSAKKEGSDDASTLDESTAAEGLMQLSSIRQWRKNKRGTTRLITHVCINGQSAAGRKPDCSVCQPKNFCLNPLHQTREGTQPRARDCSICHPHKFKRKNLCQHHKVACGGKEGCLGCLRRDRCLICNGCKCPTKKLKQDCPTCSDLFCEHGTHKWDHKNAKCSCWETPEPQ